MRLYRIYKTHFSAAHRIKGHKKCGKLHGHNYKVYVYIEGKREQFLDFHIIKVLVDKILEKLDHETLPDELSTAEQIAKYLRDAITSYAIAAEDFKPEVSEFKLLLTEAEARKAEEEGLKVIRLDNRIVEVVVWETEKFGVAVG